LPRGFGDDVHGDLKEIALHRSVLAVSG